MPVSPIPSRENSIDMHKLAIMSQNMEAQFDYISQFMNIFVSSRSEPVELSTVEQTIDRCRQLEANLRSLRAMLRLHKVCNFLNLHSSSFFKSQKMRVRLIFSFGHFSTFLVLLTLESCFFFAIKFINQNASF